MSTIVPVVEGDGELDAVPVLLRKILWQRCQRQDVQIARPKNTRGKGKLVRSLERYLEYAAITPGCTGILVLLDAHGDCPKKVAPDLAHRSERTPVNKPIAVVWAKEEYEAWFLASLETITGKPLKGRPGIEERANYGGSIEDLAGVKEWLTQHMPPGRAYKETSDQATLTELIDLDTAHRRSRSFRRLCHAVEQLVQAMDTGTVIVTPT